MKRVKVDMRTKIILGLVTTVFIVATVALLEAFFGGG